jgi:hypothetical protein
MKTKIITLTISCFLGSCAAFAQVDPSAIGVPGPQPGKGLVYAFRYGQTAQFAQQQDTLQTSSVSASLGYANKQQRLPFTMNYGGGYIWTISGPTYQNGQFHRMDLSQGIVFKRSTINLEDNVSYLPQSPTVGFAGIPGIGDIVGAGPVTPSSSQSILTQSTHVLDNVASGDIEHSLNYATSVDVGGSYELLRFPDIAALEYDTVTGYAVLSRRLSGRNTVFGRAGYYLYSFTGTPISLSSGTVQLGFRRRWTRNLTSSISAGPQQLKSSTSLLIPTNLSYAVNATLNYQRRFSSFDGMYAHGVTGGSGYLYGGVVDTAIGDYYHQIGPKTQLGLTGGYNRTASLNNNGNTNSEYGGAQVTWRVAGNFILFANYSATNQTTTSSLSNTALNNLRHYVGFGFGLSSRETRPRP